MFFYFKFPPKNENLAKKSKNSKSIGIQPNTPDSPSKGQFNDYSEVEKKEELTGATSHWESVNWGDTLSRSFYWHHSVRIE